MQKLLYALFAAICLTGAGVAQGQVVTYTFTGTGDGTVNGTAFTAQTYTFKVTAQKATVQNGAPPYSNLLDGGTITVAGSACAGGCTITNPGNYVVFNTSDASPLVHGLSLVGEIDVDGSTLLEGCWDCGAPLDDNLVTPVPPTPSGADGAEEPYAAFPSSGGVVQITNLDSEITYSVTLGGALSTATPVPSLAPTGLALLGALLAVSAWLTLRRRGGKRA